MLIRFMIYGLGGIALEVIYTSLAESVTSRDWTLKGRSYLWMLPVYGLIVFLYEPAHDLIRAYPWLARAAIWSLGFTAVEFAAGLLIQKVVGQVPWDYSEKRFAINSLIRWDFFILWAVVGLALEPIHDGLAALTPAIERLLA